MKKIYKLSKNIYNINGTEIARLAPSRFKGYGMGVQALAGQLDELLEALSDKEETKLTTGDFVKKDDKGKWVGCLGYEKEGIVVGTDPLKVIEETKQEECLHLKQKILHKLDGSTEETCRDCGKDIGGSKQSTSLKEYVLRIVLDNYGEPVQTTDKVLELIQSHLVKEIETLEPDKYMKMHDKRLDGYTFAKQDIITIINNIN